MTLASEWEISLLSPMLIFAQLPDKLLFSLTISFWGLLSCHVLLAPLSLCLHVEYFYLLSTYSAADPKNQQQSSLPCWSHSSGAVLSGMEEKLQGQLQLKAEIPRCLQELLVCSAGLHTALGSLDQGEDLQLGRWINTAQGDCHNCIFHLIFKGI